MSGNILKNCSNFIEQSCNEVTRDIIGGFASPVEKVISNNVEKLISNNVEKVISNNVPVLENGIIKTNYILFGYEMSSPVFILLVIVLLLIVLYIIFKLYKWLFAQQDNDIVTIKKFKNKKKDNSDDNDEESTYSTIPTTVESENK